MTTTLVDTVPAPPTPDTDESEAFRVSLGLVHNKTGAIPPEMLVEHVLSGYRGTDWSVRRAAIEALVRRLQSGRGDKLRVARRPENGQWRGVYETKRPRSKARPYRTLLSSVAPTIAGSCDCPDFRINGLGVCKHLLAVLDDLAGRTRRFDQARREGALDGGTGAPRLRWDPIRPMFGPGDWLERVQLEPGDRSARARSATWRRLERRFTPGVEDAWVLKNAHLDDERRRLALVEDLRAGARAGSRALPADPAVPVLLDDEHERLSIAVENKKHATRFRKSFDSLERPLYDYQREGVETFLAKGRLLLADDMGIGKTAQAVAACHALWKTGRARRGLLIVPASLKFQWQCEWQACSPAPVAIVEGSPGERRRIYRQQREGFLIANYEQLFRDLDVMSGWRPDIVVLDEAQRIKNWETRTAGCVKELRPPYRLILTGTPFENRLTELASVLEWVDRRPLEPVWRLNPFHAITADGQREIRGARNLDTLRERLAPVLLRRRRAEVLTQLPPRTDTRVDVPFTEAQREEHDALMQPIARLLAITNRRPLTQQEFLKLMQLLTKQRMIANGLAQIEFASVWPGISNVRPDDALLRSLSTPKLYELREIVARIALEQERKVVVFSQWRRMLKLASWASSDLLAESDARAAFFTGEEGARRRTKNIVDFHDDPATRILFATDAGGVGLNLQRAATCCVNLDLPWNPAVLEQRVGRIYRLGQEQPIDVYNLVTEDSIEARIATLVSDKKALFDGVFDGDSNEIRFEESGSFLQGVRKIVEPSGNGAQGAGAAGVDEDIDDVDDLDVVDEVDESDVIGGGVDTERTEPERPAVAPGQDSADGRSADGRVGERRGKPQVASAQDVERLFSELEIEQTADGRIRIEASAEAAQTLSALFQGMAALLGQGAGGRGPASGSSN